MVGGGSALSPIIGFVYAYFHEHKRQITHIWTWAEISMNTVVPTVLDLSNLYSDSRTHGYQGPSRNVRLYRATPTGGGAISKSEDGGGCAVTGKESLRIIHINDGSRPQNSGHKWSVGRGGHRIDASRNLWEGSGLKIDCASTDIAWGRGVFNNKILTSARNGELIIWDINKTGPSKYERRSKDHIRSINTMSVSHIVHHYCITGSADGDMRVWDLRDMSRSLMRVHHSTSVRSIVFSPSAWQPLHAIVGLDNGSIYRWDLKMGQRGLMDRLSVAHTASVTSLDWCNRVFTNPVNMGGAPPNGALEGPANGLGWLVSGSLDHCVKVWDLTAPGANTRMPAKPTYTLHPSFPVRHVAWRPSYECELAVVSNADFSTGSNPDLAQNNSVGAGGTGGIVGGKHSGDGKIRPIGGDAVEIWDVRRGWIPKWSVVGSAGEGGVTDLVFGDSDVIWAHHSSGAFSQIDLRNCTKPLDSITRTATTWEASGSLTFVSEVEQPWQVPYDDIAPEKRIFAERYHVKMKALGDPRYTPLLQDIGTLANNHTTHDLEVLRRLACGYVIHGQDRSSICTVNARVALQTRQSKLARIWLLLSASLNEQMLFSQSATPLASNNLPTSQSAHTGISSTYSFPSSGNAPSQLRKTSPGQAPTLPSRSASTSVSRKMTPASSNSSSPRQHSNQLPPTTPRRPSLFGGREHAEVDISRRSSVSVLRRPSTSVSGSHSTSPGERGGASGSLRHVGEGALDDSDSSSSNESDNEPGEGESSDEETSFQPLISPALLPPRGIPAPSPLSRVAGQQKWSEDESQEQQSDGDGDESSSPSPRSTDTESVGSSSSPRHTKSVHRTSKRHSTRMKSRSYSSTVASLAAPAMHPLTRQDSHSSVRTVTAVGHPVQEGSSGIKPDETIHNMRDAHDRYKSIAVSDFPLEPLPAGANRKGKQDAAPSRLTDRRIEMIRVDEKRFRDIAWAALREALEVFADEGDIQMCAMLALIAPQELGISPHRSYRFLESYIELLTRHRLHACCAYLRKYSRVEDIQKMTMLETTIYTACGRCRKPISIPAGPQTMGQPIKGGYSYCLTCRASCVKCTICQLPVRALRFQCSVCSHGGHHACYRTYYMHLQRPVLVPGSFVSAVSWNKNTSGTDEDNTWSSTADSTTDPSQTRLAGFPCATGCGHFCWMTNFNSEEP